MGLTLMNSLLSLNTSMKSMETLNSSRVSVQGMLRTEKDEEKKAKLEERLQSIEQNIYDSTKEVNERIVADSEKIREEKAAKAKADEKAEKTADASKSEKTAEVPESSQTIPTGDGTESPAVIVEISTAGNSAVKAEKPIPNTPVSVEASPPVKSPTGNKLDIKV